MRRLQRLASRPQCWVGLGRAAFRGDGKSAPSELTICLFLVVDLVEVLVDCFEKFLLLVMAGDQGGGTLDRSIV
jgi:hypothetical protein